MSKWKHIKIRAGKPQVKAQLEPLPPGPYLKTSQHESPYGSNTDSFEEPRLGEEVYCFNESGEPYLVSYWYDTSD
jgi:hypothetical protein